MTGLFDALNARFAPDGAPAIRARPVSRFEGEMGGTLEEEADTRRAEPPAPTPFTEPATREAKIGERTEKPQGIGEARTAKEAPIEAEHKDAGAVTDVVGQKETSAPHFPPAPEPLVMAKPLDDAAVEPSNSRTETSHTEILRETHETLRETVLPADAPTRQPPSSPTEAIRTKPPAPDAPQPEKPAPEPKVQPASPTIRIGRIEVRRPVKEQAPPAPPAPPRKDPPATGRAAPASRGSKGRLTDYLGWKA